MSYFNSTVPDNDAFVCYDRVNNSEKQVIDKPYEEISVYTRWPPAVTFSQQHIPRFSHKTLSRVE